MKENKQINIRLSNLQEIKFTPEFAEYLDGLHYLIQKGYELCVSSQKGDNKIYLLKSKEDLDRFVEQLLD